MNRFTWFLGMALLTVLTLALGGQKANAERWGGPAGGMVTIPPYQSYYVDVPFVAGRPAVVSSSGNGLTDLGLYIHDGDGNVSVADGFRDRKTAIMNVVRPGLFRIEVRNLGPVPNNVFLGTN